ncbi:MAG: hypothetical protein R3F65_21915 [bacterium]
MRALVLILALLALPTRPWLERDGAAIVLSVDLAPLFDDALRTRLQSGLSTTLRLRVELRDEDDAVVGFGWRVARVRYDLWDETLTAVVDTPQGPHTATHPSIDAFVTAFARLDRVPLAAGVPRDARVIHPVLRLEINPVSAEKLARMRRWLTSPEGTVIDPFGSGLLGSFVRLFDNMKPGIAERVLTLAGQPVRADRLPYVGPIDGGE